MFFLLKTDNKDSKHFDCSFPSFSITYFYTFLIIWGIYYVQSRGIGYLLRKVEVLVFDYL